MMCLFLFLLLLLFLCLLLLLLLLLLLPLLLLLSALLGRDGVELVREHPPENVAHNVHALLASHQICRPAI